MDLRERALLDRLGVRIFGMEEIRRRGLYVVFEEALGIVTRILDGSLAKASFETHPIFGLSMPTAVEGVPSDVLNPRNTWKDKKAYDSTARDLTQRFEKNFQQFESHVDGKVKQAAIRAAA